MSLFILNMCSYLERELLVTTPYSNFEGLKQNREYKSVEKPDDVYFVAVLSHCCSFVAFSFSFFGLVISR